MFRYHLEISCANTAAFVSCCSSCIMVLVIVIPPASPFCATLQAIFLPSSWHTSVVLINSAATGRAAAPPGSSAARRVTLQQFVQLILFELLLPPNPPVTIKDLQVFVHRYWMREVEWLGFFFFKWLLFRISSSTLAGTAVQQQCEIFPGRQVWTPEALSCDCLASKDLQHNQDWVHYTYINNILGMLCLSEERGENWAIILMLRNEHLDRTTDAALMVRFGLQQESMKKNSDKEMKDRQAQRQM